ncbi:MAG TPA: arginine--tRNA ligase [Mycobacteriales bacterium]
MTPAELSSAVLDATQTVFAERGLDATALPGTVTVERPRNPEHGDYATNVALQVAKRAGVPPRDLAGWVAERLAQTPGIQSAEIAGPGFLNIRLDAAAAGKLAQAIVEAGPEYGRGSTLTGRKIDLEFISANPTGPLHLGHSRWAAVGDALHRVLAAAGAEVTSEFYVNDRGAQMDRFGASIRAAATGQPIPEDGYHGEYIGELAREIVADRPDILELPEDAQVVEFREEGYRRQLAEQQRVLADMGVHFDVWYSERSLYESGAVKRGLEKLREQGHVFTADGAEWLRTTDYGDDKDRVLIRSNGETTYFASDTAYYVDKRDRGFDQAIYMLGADHHGYVGRLKALAACAGDDPAQTLDVMIGQLVKILKGGEEVRLSKRAGNIVTLEDFLEMAGVDAVRYSLTRYPTDSPLTLDIEDITRRTNDNPVFYVQYAHARIASLLRNAADVGVDRGELRPELLDHEKEGLLLGALGDYPKVVATAAELREPHRIARYLEELAGVYHRFYDACRVLPMGDEEPTDTHRARLWLTEATRTVLANGLGLLGVSAPDRM